MAEESTLVSLTTSSANTYINANLVRLPIGNGETRAVIMTQGPLENTAGDFWRMVYEQRSPVVAMVTSLVELNKVKCYAYWPEVRGKKFQFAELSVVNLNVSTVRQFVVSTLRVTDADTGDFHDVTHLRFAGWPDTGVPTTAAALLDLVSEYEAFAGAGEAAATITPSVLHCSAGVGRTGVFGALLAMKAQVYKPLRGLDVMAREAYAYSVSPCRCTPLPPLFPERKFELVWYVIIQNFELLIYCGHVVPGNPC